MGLLDSTQFDRLAGTLDAMALRHRVIANNIANADTPYFKRTDVRFEELLKKQMDSEAHGSIVGYRTDPKHFYIGRKQGVLPEPQLVTDKHSSINNNHNNVDIDREMSLLAKNQLEYYLLIQQTSHEIKNLRTAIGGRM